MAWEGVDPEIYWQSVFGVDALGGPVDFRRDVLLRLTKLQSGRIHTQMFQLALERLSLIHI